MLRTQLVRLGLVALVSTAGCAAIGEGREQENLGEQTGGIVGGTDATAFVEAVLVDMYAGGQLASHCSGAVVAPRVVLTAGHCVQGYDGWKVRAPFAGGQTAGATGAAVFDYTSDSEYVEPDQHDVGLVFLDKDIKLAKYPLLQGAKLAAGTKVKNVGRIDDGDLSTTKLFVGAAVKAYDGKGYGFPLSYVTSEIIESGDSGGPVFLASATQHTIVAVNSGGGGGTQVLARVDLLESWIDGQIKAHPGGSAAPPADPCQGIDYAGTCDGTKVVWCESKQLKSIDCATAGGTCGWNAQASYYDCK